MRLLAALDSRLTHGWRRAAAVALVFVAVALLLASDTAFGLLQHALDAAEPVIAARPVAGAVLFVLLAAASALLAFFSSALLVPVGVHAWGVPVTIALLWLGWLLGGMCTFAIGRWLRKPLLRGHGVMQRIAFYAERMPRGARFPLVLLLQLALPSEIPGYLCGLVGVRFSTYAAALALAELPYAVGAVLAGESVVQRQGGWLIALGVAGAVLSLGAAWALRRRLRS